MPINPDRKTTSPSVISIIWIKIKVKAHHCCHPTIYSDRELKVPNQRV